MTPRAAGLLKMACDTQAPPEMRMAYWRAYEIERDYELVHTGLLGLSDIPHQRRESVYNMIVARNVDILNAKKDLGPR